MGKTVLFLYSSLRGAFKPVRQRLMINIVTLFRVIDINNGDDICGYDGDHFNEYFVRTNY